MPFFKSAKRIIEIHTLWTFRKSGHPLILYNLYQQKN